MYFYDIAFSVDFEAFGLKYFKPILENHSEQFPNTFVSEHPPRLFVASTISEVNEVGEYIRSKILSPANYYRAIITKIDPEQTFGFRGLKQWAEIVASNHRATALDTRTGEGSREQPRLI